jgi:Pectate lyase superfamily protein
LAVEEFANLPGTTVTSGGTAAPASGTVETWTVANSSPFPAASSTGTPPTQFHVADANLNSEMILVTNVSGTTWTVTRGAESTTPVAHTAGFTVYQVVTAGAYAQLRAVNWLNVVTQFAADPTGAADSTTAIQNALAAAAPGNVVYLQAGTYLVSSKITLPSLVTLMGDTAISVVENVQDGGGQAGTVLKVSASWDGSTSVLYLPDNATARTIGGSVLNLTINGTSYSSTAVDGIQAFGPVIQTAIHNVAVENMSGWGIRTLIDSGATGNQYPNWWDVQKLMVNECAAGGCWLIGMTDATWQDCYVLFCGKGGTAGPGWKISGCDNSHFTDCRAEWCGTSGLYITGAWTTGTGAGGCSFTGFSTDRNEQNGILIDATGNSPVVFTSLMLRRDGRNAKSGGGGYGGLALSSAGLPVIVSGITVFPGVDDDGTGTNSPQYAVTQATSTCFSIDAGYLQGNSAAINMDFSGVTWVGGGICTAAGTTASPSALTGQKLLSGILSDISTYGGNIDLHNAGTGLKIAEGSNAKQGTLTLNGTTAVVVSNTSVTANSRIFLTIQLGSGTVGSPYVSARTAGTSFSVKSTAAGDTSTCAYEIIEPG